MGLLRLVPNIEADPVLALVAIGRLTETDRNAMEDQKLFLYDYDVGKTMVSPAELPLVRRNGRGAKVREVRQLKVKSKLLEEFATHECLRSLPGLHSVANLRMVPMLRLSLPSR